MSIAERIAQVRAEIARAARAAGRDPGEMQIEKRLERQGLAAKHMRGCM